MTLHDAVAGAQRAAGRQRAGERPERLLVVRGDDEQVLAPRARGDGVEAQAADAAQPVEPLRRRPPPGRRRPRPRAPSRWRRRAARRPGSTSPAGRPPARRRPPTSSQAMRRGWRPADSSISPGRSTARPSAVPRTRAGRLRVHIGPVRTAHGAPGSSSSSSTPGTSTRAASTASARRNERSCSRSPSQTAHQPARNGPTRTVAAHSIRSGPKAPTQVQSLRKGMAGILASP